MSDVSRREWRFYLDDMIDFAGKVLVYTDGLDQAGVMTMGQIMVFSIRTRSGERLATLCF